MWEQLMEIASRKKVFRRALPLGTPKKLVKVAMRPLPPADRAVCAKRQDEQLERLGRAQARKRRARAKRRPYGFDYEIWKRDRLAHRAT